MPAASHSAFIHLTSSLKRFLIDDKQQNPRLAVSYFISKPSFSLSLFHFNPFSIHSIFVSFHLYIFTAHLSLLPAAMWGSLLSSFKYPLRLSWSTWKHFLLFFALSYIHIQVASQALLVHLEILNFVVLAFYFRSVIISSHHHISIEIGTWSKTDLTNSLSSNLSKFVKPCDCRGSKVVFYF